VSKSALIATARGRRAGPRQLSAVWPNLVIDERHQRLDDSLLSHFDASENVACEVCERQARHAPAHVVLRVPEQDENGRHATLSH